MASIYAQEKNRLRIITEKNYNILMQREIRLMF